jgi:hypothetical protein
MEKTMQAAVNAVGLTYRYGRGTEALHGVDLCSDRTARERPR